MILLNKLYKIFVFSLFNFALQAQAQSLVACKDMRVQSSLALKDHSYFYTESGLDELRNVVLDSVEIVKDFQNFRKQEILNISSYVDNQTETGKTFLMEFTKHNQSFRKMIALGFRPTLSKDRIQIDFNEMVNADLDTAYFRALPKGPKQPLTKNELQETTQVLKDFFTTEILFFEKLLEREAQTLPKGHPHFRLISELRLKKSLNQKLLIQNKLFQSHLLNKLSIFRAQQRDLALKTLFQSPPLAFTVSQSLVSQKDYHQAVVKIIENGDREVQKLSQSVSPWIDPQQYLELKEKVKKRTISHKKVTVANAFLSLQSLFEYIPAVEQALLKTPQSCESVERALEIHYRQLNSDQIRSYILIAGFVAVSPFAGGPLLTAQIVGGLAVGTYSLSQTQLQYNMMVESALTELTNENLDGAFLKDLQDIETSIRTQEILLPTLLSGIGFGIKNTLSLLRLKNI